MAIYSYGFYLPQDKYYIDPKDGKEYIDTSPDHRGRVRAASIHEAFAKSIAKAFGKKYGWFPDQRNTVDGDSRLVARGSLTEHCDNNSSRVVGKIMTAVIARA